MLPVSAARRQHLRWRRASVVLGPAVERTARWLQRGRRNAAGDPDGSPSLRSAEPSGFASRTLYGAAAPRPPSPQSRHIPPPCRLVLTLAMPHRGLLLIPSTIEGDDDGDQ